MVSDLTGPLGSGVHWLRVWDLAQRTLHSGSAGPWSVGRIRQGGQKDRARPGRLAESSGIWVWRQDAPGGRQDDLAPHWPAVICPQVAAGSALWAASFILPLCQPGSAAQLIAAANTMRSRHFLC